MTAARPLAKACETERAAKIIEPDTALRSVISYAREQNLTVNHGAILEASELAVTVRIYAVAADLRIIVNGETSGAARSPAPAPPAESNAPRSG